MDSQPENSAIGLEGRRVYRPENASTHFQACTHEVAPLHCTVSVSGAHWSCACGDLHPVARNLFINQDQVSMGLDIL